MCHVRVVYLLLVSWLVMTGGRVAAGGRLTDEQALMERLFNEQQYDNSVRPVFNSSRNVVVTFGFTLIQIMDMVRLSYISSTISYTLLKRKKVVFAQVTDLGLPTLHFASDCLDL